VITPTAGINLDIGQAAMGYMNYQQQKDQLAYQRRLQKKMFAREDTAVQRRAADLRKAGLSQTLAAGGGAQAGPVVSTQAPQVEGFGIGGLLDITAKVTDILKTQELTENIKAQKGLIDAQTSAAQKSAMLRGGQLALLGHNLDYYRKWGVPSTFSGRYAEYLALVNMVMKVAPDVGKKLQGFGDIMKEMDKSPKLNSGGK